MITNMAQFSTDLRGVEQAIIQSLSKVADSPERDAVLTDAANTVVNAMRNKAPVANRTVKRYKAGKVVAIYRPGNLKRAIMILDMKDKRSKYAGVKIARRGEGKGETVDGWYAKFVEYGKHKRPFIRPAVAEVSNIVLNKINRFVEKQLK